MATRDIVVIGASAGGVDAIRRLMSSLPQRFDATVFVVLHRRPEHGWHDRLASVLTWNSPLQLQPAEDGRRFGPGEVYVAPPDMHLLVERGVVRLERSPKVNHSRPSIDVLFRSAAAAYGRRVVGVVLSGALNDGTVGLWQVRKYGGIAIAQDPAEAAHGDLLHHVMANVPVHYCLPVEAIGRRLGELTAAQPARPDLPVRLLIVEDERIVARDLANRLKALGYEVVGSVASAEDALTSAAAAMPDLVLMDISLAGAMRGTEAAAILWEQYQLPVVFLTAYSDERTLDEAKRATPFGFVVKPYHPEQLHAAIQLALDRHEREMDLGAPTE